MSSRCSVIVDSAGRRTHSPTAFDRYRSSAVCRPPHLYRRTTYRHMPRSDAFLVGVRRQSTRPSRHSGGDATDSPGVRCLAAARSPPAASVIRLSPTPLTPSPSPYLLVSTPIIGTVPSYVGVGRYETPRTKPADPIPTLDGSTGHSLPPSVVRRLTESGLLAPTPYPTPFHGIRSQSLSSMFVVPISPHFSHSFRASLSGRPANVSERVLLNALGPRRTG